jgi:hypothetical protein
VNERPRYYARQLITPDDLTLEQDYFRTKLRRHNRFLHGWGVVCGADVVQAEQPWKVIVTTGYILGPYGDEIYIEKNQCVDVRKLCTSARTQVPPDDLVECAEALPPPPPPDETRYVAIRYAEKQARLVRVPLGGCGCEDNACEYSRFSDGYEICVLDECPDSHMNPPSTEELNRGAAPECPECPTDPWVVLSAFRVKDDEGNIELQECDCRRQVNAFGHFWWSCTGAGERNRLAARSAMDLAPNSTTEPAKEPTEQPAPAGGTTPPST